MIRITDLDNEGNIDVSSSPFVQLTESEENIFSIKKGDFLFPRTGSIGLLGVAEQDMSAAFASYLIRFRFNQKALPSFMKFYFMSDIFISGLLSDLHGGVNQNIHAENIKDQYMVLPPVSEQNKISIYLNSQTKQISSLIQKKQQMIALLEEEKTAIINEAVTKGVDPDAPMKDSGIEWLGMIPEHWEVKKLKHVAAVRSGFALNGSIEVENSIKLPYLRVANVQDGYLRLDNVTEVSIDQTVAHRYFLQSGDLLMNEGGDNDKLGRGCVWRGQINPCLHQNHVFAVRMKNNVNPDWINAVTLTNYARQYFMVHCKQSTNLASISQTNIKELPVLMPPSIEVIEILTFVGNHIDKIYQTITHIKKEIELLQEYRTALISEAVTGKIDVRNYQLEPQLSPALV